MNCKMNTKFIAALAVFAMAFAGFGMVFATEANDADDPVIVNGSVTVNIAGVIDAKDLLAVLGEGWSMLYTVTFDDDIEEKITVITKDYYDAVKNEAKKETGAKVFIKGNIVTFDPSIISAPAYSDVVEGLVLFTSLEMNKLGEITGGVDTTLKFVKGDVTADDAKNIKLDFVFEEDAEAAIIAAVALVEAEYADYFSPEEVEALIEEIKGELYTKEELDTAVAKAIADTKALYKDWKSPEDVKKACDKAVEDYIATHPVKKDDTFLYVTIVLAAIVIALAGFMVFDKVIKPKMAKKKEVIQV